MAVKIDKLLTPNRVKLDLIDRKILHDLQINGRITNVELAGRVGISAPPCLRRVRALEKAGFIRGYYADLEPKSLGYKETGSSVAVPIFKKFVREAKVNINRIPFRVPSGLSFVKINPKTGHQSNQKDSILEPYLIGNEPFNNKKLNVLDSLGAINNDSISGTGSLLDN